MIRSKSLAAGLLALVTAALPMSEAHASHNWSVTRTDSDSGCGTLGVTTCSTYAYIYVSSGPYNCLGSPGAYTSCRAYVSCNGSASSTLSSVTTYTCTPLGSSSNISGYTGYYPTNGAEFCVSFSMKTTTVNALGSSTSSASVQFCSDITGSHYH